MRSQAIVLDTSTFTCDFWLWHCTVNMLSLMTEGKNVQTFARYSLKDY